MGFEIVEGKADRNHVHLLISYPPKLAISCMVQRLKGVSSLAIRSRSFPEVKAALYGAHFWSPSYYVGSCGGAPLYFVAEYVKNQGLSG
jgi:putative transposase